MLPPTPSEIDSGRSAAAPPAQRCAVHPDRVAHTACARCGKPACTPCTIVLAGGETICAACDDRETLPWERRAAIGLGPALARTIAGVLASPSRFFLMRSRERALWPTLLLGLSLGMVGQIAQTITAIAFLPRTRAELSEDPVGRMLLPYLSNELALIGLAAAPVLYFVQLYSIAGLWWLGLRVAGGLRRPFHVIVRALCYLEVLSLLVPIVAPLGQLGLPGRLVAMAFTIWGLGLQILAVSRMQGIEVGRGFVAFVVGASIAGSLLCLAGGAVGWAIASQIRIPI